MPEVSFAAGMTTRRIFLVIAFLAFVARASAVEWTETELHVTAKPHQKTVEVTFSYRNTGASPMRVLSALPSCDCVKVEFARTETAKGETGELDVTLSLTGLEGPQEKTIRVTTSDAPKQPVTLKLIVERG